MTDGELGLEEYQDAKSEDAWYELEGAYEVYAIGRCRFVLIHCRTAMMIGVALLAKQRDLPWKRTGAAELARMADMPPHLLDSFNAILTAGSYRSILEVGSDDQEGAATILSRTLEVFEWMRMELTVHSGNDRSGKR